MSPTRLGKEGQKTTLTNWVTPQKGNHTIPGKDKTTGIKPGSTKGSGQDRTPESPPGRGTASGMKTFLQAAINNTNPTEEDNKDEMEGVEIEGETRHMDSNDDEDKGPGKDKSLPAKEIGAGKEDRTPGHKGKEITMGIKSTNKKGSNTTIEPPPAREISNVATTPSRSGTKSTNLTENENEDEMKGVVAEEEATRGDNDKDEDMESEQRDSLPLKGWRLSSTGQFNTISSKLGPENDLYNGKNNLKRLVISHGGKFDGFLTKNTDLMIVGSKPCRKTITKAGTSNTNLISYATLEAIIEGTVDPEMAQFEPLPEIKEYSLTNRGILRNTTPTTDDNPKELEETAPAKVNPPTIVRNTNFPADATYKETEEAAAAKVTFAEVKLKKKRKEVSTPEGTPERQLVDGTTLLGRKGVLDTSLLGKNRCKYASVVYATIRVPHGDVKSLVMELLFMGLDTLRAEDKTVCFLHPNDPSQKAKARKDMPDKFQRIHADWMVFDQPITRFKNDIREGRTRTFNVSFWLGSKLLANKILDQCTLEWEETRSNGGFVKMNYKRVQALHTARNLILVGVPTDLDAGHLQSVLREKMEEARQKMVAKNSYKYGSLTKVPQFVLEKDFIKNTPYAERSNDDNIPFWAKMPFHLEYQAMHGESLEHILAYMYRTKRFQGLFGEAAFYHRNPGVEATAGERDILAGVLMRHIAMVRSSQRIILKGLTKPDRLHTIQRLDDEGEVDMEITRSVREIMMEKKIQGTKVWIVLGMLTDGRWAGYFRYGIGNDPHRAHAVEWAGAVSSHIRFHLLRRGFDQEGVNNLVRRSFDLQATREAAEAVQDKDGQIKTRSQAEAEQVLQLHDKLHSGWVDITLGMTKAQREDHAQQQANQASAQAKINGLDRNYNFDDTHSINPTEGRPDDGTAVTRANNASLGETAYDVVQPSKDSDLEDIICEPYSDEENNPDVDLDMNEVHRNTGRKLRRTGFSSSDEGETQDKTDSTTSDQGNSHEHDASGGHSSTNPTSAGGGREGYGRMSLPKDLSKTSLRTTEATPHQDQVSTPDGPRGLAPGGT